MEESRPHPKSPVLTPRQADRGGDTESTISYRPQRKAAKKASNLIEQSAPKKKKKVNAKEKQTRVPEKPPPVPEPEPLHEETEPPPEPEKELVEEPEPIPDEKLAPEAEKESAEEDPIEEPEKTLPLNEANLEALRPKEPEALRSFSTSSHKTISDFFGAPFVSATRSTESTPSRASTHASRVSTARSASTVRSTRSSTVHKTSGPAPPSFLKKSGLASGTLAALTSKTPSTTKTPSFSPVVTAQDLFHSPKPSPRRMQPESPTVPPKNALDDSFSDSNDYEGFFETEVRLSPKIMAQSPLLRSKTPVASPKRTSTPKPLSPVASPVVHASPLKSPVISVRPSLEDTSEVSSSSPSPILTPQPPVASPKSPSRSPVKSSVVSPKSSVVSPKSPPRSPTKSPVASPKRSSARSPTNPPVSTKSPLRSPVVSPKSPIRKSTVTHSSPIQSPLTSPRISSPVKSPQPVVSPPRVEGEVSPPRALSPRVSPRVAPSTLHVMMDPTRHVKSPPKAPAAPSPPSRAVTLPKRLPAAGIISASALYLQRRKEQQKPVTVPTPLPQSEPEPEIQVEGQGDLSERLTAEQVVQKESERLKAMREKHFGNVGMPMYPTGFGMTSHHRSIPIPNFDAMADVDRAFTDAKTRIALATYAESNPGLFDPNWIQKAPLPQVYGALTAVSQSRTVEYKVNTYKFWFSLSIYALEFIFTRVLGFKSAKKFAETQIELVKSRRYDAMLIELSQKYSITGFGSQPVEFRLAFATGVNALVYIGLMALGSVIRSDYATMAARKIYPIVLRMVSPQPTGDPTLEAMDPGAAPPGLVDERFAGEKELGEIMGLVNKGTKFAKGAATAKSIFGFAKKFGGKKGKGKRRPRESEDESSDDEPTPRPRRTSVSDREKESPKQKERSPPKEEAPEKIQRTSNKVNFEI